MPEQIPLFFSGIFISLSKIVRMLPVARLGSVAAHKSSLSYKDQLKSSYENMFAGFLGCEIAGFYEEIYHHA